jgi:hypothetical protein
MRHTLVVLSIVVLAALLPPRAALAGSVGTEVWVGGGASWLQGRDKPMACVRGGAGIVFARYFAIGASGHGDRDNSYYFADATVIFPKLGLYEPYGRFHFGRRDHSSDDAMGWTAGLRLGEDAVQIFLEGYGIIEPDENYGAVFGISF